MARVYVWLCAAFVGIGGIMWGYEVSSTNGIKEMSGFRQTFNISYSSSEHAINQTVLCVSVDDVETSALLGAVVSVFSIGALVGALLSGLLSDLAGRKMTVIVGASLYAFGGTLQTSSFFLWMLFPARIISGIGTGITLQICPLYIAEIAPKERRGVLVAMVNAVGVTGLVAGIVISTITERYTFGWRVTASVEILVGSVLALGALLLYETPRFLVKKKKDAKALKVLIKIHGDHTRAQSELTEIQMSVRESVSHHKSCSQMLKHLCSVSIVQRVLIGYVLMLMTRICGVPVIAYYSVSIFCKVGVDGFIGTVVQVMVMFIAQITGALLIDKCGRKPLLLLGTVVMGILLAMAAALIQLFDLEEGINLSTAQKIAGYFVIILICLFMASFVLSFGTSTWIVVSEIYPLQIRGIGAALGQLGWWSGTVFMGEIGPILLSSQLRTSGTFYLFAGMCFLAFLHALLLIPETKGQSLESIEHLFAKPWSRRVNVLYYIRCGCFCCPRRAGMELVPTDAVMVDSEEREQLQEPLDQISLSSTDSAEADISVNSLKNTETSI